MKKKFFALCVLGLFLSGLFVSPAAALVSESKQIARYNTIATAGEDGIIQIEFSINGTGIMDKVGAKEIRVYEKQGTRWIQVKYYGMNDDGMYAKDTFHFYNQIDYSGTSGAYYRVSVTVFAEDSDGSDSRTEVHYVTAK